MKLQIVSIVIEALIALLALMSMRRKSYMGGLAVTFGIYVYYDLARYYGWHGGDSMLTTLFFVATLTALYSVFKIYRNR